MLARYQAQPRAEFASVPEFVCVADGSHQCSCDQHADSFNPGKTLTPLVLAKDTFDLEIVLTNALVHEPESFGHLVEHLAEEAA